MKTITLNNNTKTFAEKMQELDALQNQLQAESDYCKMALEKIKKMKNIGSDVVDIEAKREQKEFDAFMASDKPLVL